MFGWPWLSGGSDFGHDAIEQAADAGAGPRHDLRTGAARAGVSCLNWGQELNDGRRISPSMDAFGDTQPVA